MTDTLASMESSHSIYINRLASHEANKLNQFWGSYLRLLQNALAGYDSDITQRQLNKLIREIDELIGANMEDWQEQFLLNMDDLAEYEADFQAAAIGAITGNDLAVPATQQVVAAALSNPISMGSAGAVDLSSWLENLTSSQKQRIESEIKLGYTNGVGNQELVRRIVGTRSNKFTDGIADIDRRSAVTLVRTTTNHYASVARRMVYEENKNVVIGHRWVSTLDGRTSVICRGRDGEEYLYDDGKVEYPPAHPGCRSSTSPIVKGYNSRNPQGQRASRGGKLVDGELKSDPKPVSATEDYYEWLKKQPAEFQDDVLGKTKGKIFRNSGVSVGKFKSLLLDEMQRPLTIKEMAVKDKKIASYLSGL